jgi:hypothetical protein
VNTDNPKPAEAETDPKFEAMRKGIVEHRLGEDPWEFVEQALLSGKRVEFEFPAEPDRADD